MALLFWLVVIFGGFAVIAAVADRQQRRRERELERRNARRINRHLNNRKAA